MKTSEILNKAADLIETRGWGQGNDTWNDPRGKGLCLEGALMAALGIGRGQRVESGFYSCPAHDAVANYLGRQPTPRTAPVTDALWGWNDTPGRTANEVIEVLRAAAVIEQAKESEPAKAEVSV